MKIIAWYNAKGGIGSTTGAAHTCIHAAEHGVRVAGASLEQNRELRRWLTSYGIPWFDATEQLPSDVELLVLDVWSHSGIADALSPDLWVMGMDNRTAFENACNVLPGLSGPALWVWSRVFDEPGYAEELRARFPVPEHLQSRVTLWDESLPWTSVIENASENCVAVWEGGNSAEARLLRELAQGILERVGCRSREHHPLTRVPSTFDESALCRDFGRRERAARERLQTFFANLDSL